MLLLAVVIAAGLRLWQLDGVPPGFYRDEAYNGLDALNVLAGQHPLYFTANNGREPAYIYLTALFVQTLGRQVWVVRLAAAITGTLTTFIVYLLARTWFGRRAGLLAAWLWAVTLWPVHLSRIGLRPILLVPCLALTFWLGTLAYRRQRAWLWAAAGLAYGASFYTYLASRFTPLLLGLLLFFLLLQPGRRRRLWPGVLWFAGSTALVLLPLALVVWHDPALLLGRAQQVSILSPAVNGGDLWGALWQQTLRALGLFLWQGDLIWRHNPAGRPVFDLFMAIPFLVGLGYALRFWRHPAMLALLLWTATMLGPTILAEDTPHFLRVVGILPAALLLPALGLSKLRDWPKLPRVLQQKWPAARQRVWRDGLVVVLCAATLLVTVRDYFYDYATRPQTSFYFETAARNLAEQVNVAAQTAPAGVGLYLDQRFWNGSWPAVNFLVDPAAAVTAYDPAGGLPCAPACPLPLTIFAWPYTTLDFVPQAIPVPAEVWVSAGPLAQGDLEPEPYPFFVQYQAVGISPDDRLQANFANQLHLTSAQTSLAAPDRLLVDLVWTTPAGVAQPLVVFVHVLDPAGNFIGQSDAPPAQGYWANTWWQPGLWLHDRHEIELTQPFDASQHTILVGLYESNTHRRLPVTDPSGVPVGDSWPLAGPVSSKEN